MARPTLQFFHQPLIKLRFNCRKRVAIKIRGQSARQVFIETELTQNSFRDKPCSPSRHFSYTCITSKRCARLSFRLPISRKFDNSLSFSAIPMPMVYVCALTRPRTCMRVRTELTFACGPIPLRLNHRLQTLIVPSARHPSRLINVRPKFGDRKRG